MEWDNNREIFRISPVHATYEINGSKKSNCAKEPVQGLKKVLKEPRVKARYLVIVFAFLGEIIFYYQQITMSVSIVAMVNNSAVLEAEDIPGTDSCPLDTSEVKNSTAGKTVEVEGEFLWSPKIQGYLLGSSFLCQMLAVPVFSRLAEVYGGKKTLFWSLFLASVFTFLSPFAAQCSVSVLILVQSLRGMSQGGIIPAESILVANWCPKQERGFSYTLILCGCSIGAVFGSYLTGLLCQSTYLGGWKTAFIVSGGLGFTVSAIIWFFLYDNPSVHPKISQKELHYILSNQENVLTEKRPKTPWKRLFTSVPVYALAYAYFGQMWAISHFLSINPTFLKTILHYSVEQSGLFTALPFLLTVLFAQVSGFFSTLLSNRNVISIDKMRKFLTFSSCLGYSCCVVGIYFAECNRPVIDALSMLSLGMIGFGDAGCWIVCNDMSPTFSASINAIACTMGNLAYFLLPLTVGYLTNSSQSLEQWHKVFYICISVVLSSGFVFVIFGSAEIQPWNDVTEETSAEKNKKMEFQSQILNSNDANKDTEQNCNNGHRKNVI